MTVPFTILFQVVLWFSTFLFLAKDIDMGRMVEARTIVQGGLDAAVLAGAHMQDKIPTSFNSFGQPNDWKNVINPDRASEKAFDTWMKNVEHYYQTPLYSIASVTNVDFKVNSSKTEITANLVLKMKPTASENFLKGIFGEASDFGEVDIPVKAVAQIKPENGRIITPQK